MPSKKALAVGAAVIVVGAAAAVVLASRSERVTLTYDEEACVLTSPEYPKVHKDKPSNWWRNKRAKWVPASSQKNDYHWTISYQAVGTDPDKQGTGDYLGPVEDILCTGPQMTKSEKAPNVGTGELQWPYQVGVYSCEGELICFLDPIIWIKE